MTLRRPPSTWPRVAARLTAHGLPTLVLERTPEADLDACEADPELAETFLASLADDVATRRLRRENDTEETRRAQAAAAARAQRGRNPAPR